MYARVSTYEIPLHRLEEEIRQSGDVEKTVRAIAGNQGLYYFVDRATGRTMSVSLWESEEALKASEEQGTALREELVQPTGGRIVSVERYEVALMPQELKTALAA